MLFKRRKSLNIMAKPKPVRELRLIRMAVAKCPLTYIHRGEVIKITVTSTIPAVNTTHQARMSQMTDHTMTRKRRTIVLTSRRT